VKPFKTRNPRTPEGGNLESLEILRLFYLFDGRAVRKVMGGIVLVIYYLYGRRQKYP
jgi:hypothetical protein